MDLQTNKFVKDAKEFIQQGEKRHCRVLNVDMASRKIGLSLLEEGAKASGPRNAGSDNSNGAGRPQNNGRRPKKGECKNSLVGASFTCAGFMKESAVPRMLFVHLQLGLRGTGPLI